MKGFGFQEGENSNQSKGLNTSKQKQELIVCLKRSEQLWSQEKKEESLEQLRKGITTVDFIVQNESVESSKALYEKKIIELKEKLKNREEGKEEVSKVAKGGLTGHDSNQAIKKRMRETIVTEKPNIKWQDIAGLENAKNILKEQVILTIKFKEIFTGSHKPRRGILLYGAPGTGKTYLARACAAQTEATFFSVSPCDLINKYVGQSEKLIKALFDQARERKPSIIFIDDLESIFSYCEEENHFSKTIKTELLIQIQSLSLESGVIVFASTNVPWRLDPRIRRRFQRRIYIPLPQCKARLDIMKRSIKDMNSCVHTLTQEDLEEFAKQTEGYSGSDMMCLIRDAFFEPIRRLQKAKKFHKLENGKWAPCDNEERGQSKTWIDFKDPSEMEMGAITKMDFVNSLKRCRPSVNEKQLLQFEQFTKTYGQEE